MRKGQAGALIGIITLLVIFYIVFLPPAERAKLLEEGEAGVGNVSSVKGGVLLDERVGFLSAVSEREVVHPVPNVVLEDVSSANVLLEFPSFVVSRGWFGKKSKIVSLELDDPERLGNVLVVFSLGQRRGVLGITVNGKSVFEGLLESATPAPVSVPVALLRKHNVVEVEAEGVGFWLLPRIFEVKDFKVVADVRESERLEASHIVALSQGEVENLGKGALRFFAVCDEKKVGVLSVLINDRQVFRAVPDCGSANQQELFKEDVVEGKNIVSFVLDKGSARLEQISLKNELKKPTPFIQFFQVSDKENDALKRKQLRAKLRLEFVDDGVQKQVELNVNSRKFVVDQRTALFERDVSDVLKAGNNVVSLTALSDVKITSLKIVLV